MTQLISPASEATASTAPATQEAAPGKASGPKAAVKKVVAKKAPAKKVAARKPALKKPVAKKPAAANPQAPAKAEKAVKQVKLPKPPKPAKEPKVVRDSFTMPQSDFDIIDRIKLRAIEWKQPVKKSEVLRAALHALEALTDAKVRALLTGLAPIKKGRPKAD